MIVAGFGLRGAATLARLRALLGETQIDALAVVAEHPDDLVRDHLEGFPYPDITVAHLLHHTSGIPSHLEAYQVLQAAFDTGHQLTNEDVMKVLGAGELELVAPPGELGLDW